VLAISPPAVAASHRVHLEGCDGHASARAGQARHPNSRYSCPKQEKVSTSTRAFVAARTSDLYLLPLLRNLNSKVIKLKRRLLL
jgi:hypothetical protein